MASLVVAELSVVFIMESCVRGHHVYQNTWAPIHRERLRCSRERGNRADTFAVAVVKGEDTVGHVPRRFSCATNLFIQSGKVVACERHGNRRYSHDLPQGGMEIPCVYTFSGAPDLIDKTKRRLNELQAQIKECSILLDSQQADVLPQTDSSCNRTSEQISDDSVESVKASGHKAVNLEVVEITDYNNNSMVGSNNVWLKIQDITLTLEDKHIILDGLRLSDQHINSVHRLLKQQFPTLNGLRLSLLQGPTCNAIQILHVMTNHWIITATHKSGKVVHVYDSVYSLLDQSSAKSIQRIFRCSPCNIKVESVQKYATAVAFGQDPTKVTFHQPSMRKHLVSCYMNKKMQPFPPSKI